MGGAARGQEPLASGGGGRGEDEDGGGTSRRKVRGGRGLLRFL